MEKKLPDVPEKVIKDKPYLKSSEDISVAGSKYIFTHSSVVGVHRDTENFLIRHSSGSTPDAAIAIIMMNELQRREFKEEYERVGTSFLMRIGSMLGKSSEVSMRTKFFTIICFDKLSLADASSELILKSDFISKI